VRCFVSCIFRFFSLPPDKHSRIFFNSFEVFFFSCHSARTIVVKDTGHTLLDRKGGDNPTAFPPVVKIALSNLDEGR
jgi:hypothetical protein